jgi:hypothetical protein
MGRPPQKPIVRYHDFQYQVGSWDHPRRVVAKVEWHQGELFPRVGFMDKTGDIQNKLAGHAEIVKMKYYIATHPSKIGLEDR